MTIFHQNSKAEELQCLTDPTKKCVGEKCMAWMYRQHEEKDNEGNAQKRTDPGSGVCGWLYTMAYFRDKNPNKML